MPLFAHTTPHPTKPSFLGSLDRNALGIFSFLLILYLITFTGQFTSIDELNLYSMAESLIQTGTTAVPQVGFAAYHNPVGAHEIGYPLVAAPFYWVAVHSPLVNNIYVVMLLNPMLVALTGALIFLCARQLDFSVTGSTLAALAYGLGSLGWPYAQTLYREPLVGCLWLGGLHGLLSWRNTGNKWRGGLGIVLLLLSPLVKINILFSVPFLFLVAQKGTLKGSRRLYLLLGAAAVGVVVGFQLLYRWRMGDWWSFSTPIADIDPLQILTRVYGQLFSPIKGLIFYMPIVAGMLAGLYPLWRKHPPVAWGIALAFLSLLGATSYYDAWYGGQSWGPRLLVPVLPALALPIASLWDQLRQRFARGALLAVLVVSILVQGAVVTNNWWKGYKPFLDLAPTPENSVGLSMQNVALAPPWALLKNWRASDLDLLWLQTDDTGQWHTQAAMGLLLGLCLVVVLVLWRSKAASKFGAWVWVPVLPAIVVLQVAGGQVSLGYPGLSKETAQAIVQWAQPGGSKPFTLVTLSNEFHLYFFEGFLKGDFIHHWYSPSQTDHFEPLLETRKGQWLSFVADRVHLLPTDTGKDLEGWLNQQFYRFDGQWLGGFEVAHYAMLPSDAWTWQPIQLQFGALQFKQFATNTTQLYPQEVLGVQFQVCKSAELAEVHTLFVHLLAQDTIVQGSDGPLGYGSFDVSQWKVGDCVIEKRGIYVPEGTAPGPYELILGVYTPEKRIVTTDETGQAVTYRNLTTINLLAPGTR